MKPHSADIANDGELQLNQLHLWAAKDRFLLYSGLIILAAFSVGLLISRLSSSGGAYEASAAIRRVPAVEPLLLKEVDKSTAKKANDAVLLTTAPVPPAPAFIFRGAPADFERAADCLAATIFYEAGNETVSGQMAVVQVVLNRARHPAYPKSVCGVVFQGQERRTGCQFSYTCDGSMARHPSPEAWGRFKGLSSAMLKGLVYRPVGLATHYHTDWVLPAWSANLEKVRIEGTHIFFRYNGYWGTPAAFRGRLSNSEVVFAKLARLSEAHRAADAAGDAVADEALSVADFPEAPDMERVAITLDTKEKGKEVFLIYVDPLLDPPSLTRMAENACGARKTCKVFAWADQALMPQGLPLERNDRASMAFSYVRTNASKSSKQKWNCELFPQDDKVACL